MTRPHDPLRVTETYAFALAPVIGPFLEALGNLARQLGSASDTLRTEAATLITETDTTL